MRGIRGTVFFAAALAAAVSAGRPRTASGEGEDLRPPLRGMHERRDPQGLVSIRLPENWDDQGPRAEDPTSVMNWSGFIGPPNPTGPDAWVYVRALPSCSRLRQAWHMERIGREDEAVPDTLTEGDGWIQEERHLKRTQVMYLLRFVERGGQVWELRTSSYEKVHPRLVRHMSVLFDSFQVLKPWPEIGIPPSLASSEVDGRRLWTDVKDKKVTKRFLDLHQAGWKQAAALLPGDLRWKEAPRVVLCEGAPAYQELAKGMSGGGSPFLDAYRRTFTVSTTQLALPAIDAFLHRLAAMQYCRHLFGGTTPVWVEVGLGTYVAGAVAQKGKPEKVAAADVKKMRAAAEERDSSMPALWDLEIQTIGADDFAAVSYDLWAWHVFFRHGAGAKEWGPVYRKSLDVLAETGDPSAARKEWEAADAAAMKKAYRAWLAAWKP